MAVELEPQAFSLKMRFLTPWGAPFADRWLRVRWGDELYPPPPHDPLRTDAHGAISVHLPAPAAPRAAAVLFVERAPGHEAVVWTIPIEVAPEPAPVSRPWGEAWSAPRDPGAPREDQTAYDVAFRLWNLGDLPLASPPTPRLPGDEGQIQRAVQRFACRQGLPVPLSVPAGLSVPPGFMEALERVHDRSGLLVPTRPLRSRS